MSLCVMVMVVRWDADVGGLGVPVVGELHTYIVCTFEMNPVYRAHDMRPAQEGGCRMCF